MIIGGWVLILKVFISMTFRTLTCFKSCQVLSLLTSLAGEDCQFSMLVSQVCSQKVITARELGGYVTIATAVSAAAPVVPELPPVPC